VLQALKGASVPKVLAGVLFLVGAALFALQETQEKAPRSSNPAPPITGTQAASAATPTPAPVATVAWPAGVACPPPNWPPNTPLPCTPSAPASATVTAPSTATATAVASTAPDKPPRDSGARPSALPPGAKTLERQAVDLVAAGEAAKAAGAYEELIRREPANRVYPEAARILRAKLDAGAPAP
jgi:hypothetical protein